MGRSIRAISQDRSLGRPPVTALAAFGAAVLLFLSGCSDAPPGNVQAADREQRLADLKRLAAQDADESLAALLDASGDEDETVARAAVRMAGQRGGREAVPNLRVVAAKDARSAVREEAVLQLSRTADAGALDFLKGLLRQDLDPRVRAAAATAIGRLGGWQDTSLLADIAETDPSPRVRSRAVGAIESIARVEFRYDPGASPVEQRLALARVRRWVDGTGEDDGERP